MKRGIFQNGIYLKVEREKTKLRMSGGSWTINRNDCDLTDPTLKVIRYVTELATYEITKEDALLYGFPMTFQGESKWVVPVKRWTEIKKEGPNA